MPRSAYDIVIVGGGLAGASLGKVMAEKGARVLILERETAFKDRVRGEALLPWGIEEARKLGLYDVLRETCGHEQRWFDFYLGPNQIMHRDLPSTTPQGAPMCNFYHPKMQEALITAAGRAGAEVRRSAMVTNVQPGLRPCVSFHHDGSSHEVEARIIVAADGRNSMARKWGGFSVEREPPSLLMAGVLFENMAIPEDAGFLLLNPMSFRGVFLFPQGGGRVRAYFCYPVETDHRLQGEADVPRFISESVKTGAPAEYYRDARPAGPLASFETADNWVPHPFKDGLALLGDAAACTDPSWGTGLSQALRGARVLRDRLLASDNWDLAGHEYAEEYDRSYGIIHDVQTWSREIFMSNSAEANACRMKAMPLIAQDPTRVPDHGISGPDLPFDRELIRARFYGEV